MRRHLAMAAAAAALLLLAMLAAFVWNEARKEVFFLCGNFGPGVAQASVIRQLETGQFLRYRIEPTPRGRRITMDSVYAPFTHRCVVDLDDGGTVLDAGVE